MKDAEMIKVVNWIKHADKKSRRALLVEAGQRLRSGGALPREVSKWIGDVLLAAGQGDSVDTYLGGKRGRGESKPNEHAHLLDQLMALLMERQLRNGLTRNKASEEVWLATGTDASTIRKKHKLLAVLLRRFTSERIDYEIEAHTELLGRKMRHFPP